MYRMNVSTLMVMTGLTLLLNIFVSSSSIETEHLTMLI
jgi:hypothetical protein